MSGYVYVFTNSAMSGLVKIGQTQLNPYEWAKQLRTTGVPRPFNVYGYVEVDDPAWVEKKTHSKLSQYRESKSREFFKVKPAVALKTLETVSGEFDLKRQQIERRRIERIEAEKNRALIKKQENLTEKRNDSIYLSWNRNRYRLRKKYKIDNLLSLQTISYALALISFLLGGIFELGFAMFPLLCGVIMGIILGNIVKSKINLIENEVELIMQNNYGEYWEKYRHDCIMRHKVNRVLQGKDA